MRNLLYSFLMLLICLKSFAQIDLPRTEIIIIGTIHTGNKKFNVDTLYNVLNRLNPDIILQEYHKSFKPVFGLTIATFLKIAKPSIEQLALQKFYRKNKRTSILPYDTSFPRRQYIKHYNRITQAYYDSLNNAKKSVTDSTIYLEFASMHNHFFSFIDTSSLYRINQYDIIDKSRELNTIKENAILPLGRKYIEDSLLISSIYNENQFSNLRNEYMTNKIIEYSKRFLGKRIVILTGLSHKYYLKDKLKDAINIKLIEYWE